MFRVALVTLLLCGVAHADGQQCVDLHVQFVPTDSLQIAAWVEDTAGNYEATIFLTRKIGLYGLGNRPGRFDFNSGPPPNAAMHIDDMWPYGRRITTFPVWSHRHGMTFPEVVFQTGSESDLSHPSSKSSREVTPPYCRPLDPTQNPNLCSCTDQMIWDTGTCASTVFTDKGMFSPTDTSLYPPRADLVRDQMYDSASVDMYAALDPFDAVTQATPVGGATTDIAWPSTLPPGDYVLWVELAKEFDFNATYNATAFPSPANIAYGSYGQPYRGQPSVVYSAPFTIGTAESIATALDYVGYGDPSGDDGAIRPPDATITTDTPVSGEGRLELISDGGSMYRLRVDAKPELDFAAPDPPAELVTTSVGSTGASLRFVAPGDDGQIGIVTGYEVRIRASDEMTADNFATSMPAAVTIVPAAAGLLQSFDVAGLLPDTDYWVGVRAFDDCQNESGVTIVKLTTPDAQSGAVDACFIATAAYGSIMANDVEALRRFRDVVLRQTPLGELAIETYYTFGPAVAGVVGSSELLRASARDALAPIVAWVEQLSFARWFAPRHGT